MLLQKATMKVRSTRRSSTLLRKSLVTTQGRLASEEQTTQQLSAELRLERQRTKELAADITVEQQKNQQLNSQV